MVRPAATLRLKAPQNPACPTHPSSRHDLPTAASLVAATAAQSVPLPDTPDSFLRLGGDASAQVQIDAHVDLLCPDCAAAWPVLQQVAANYAKAQVSINLHVFPLPYHTFAFSVAQGGNVIASLNSSTTAVFNWANALFDGAQVSSRTTHTLETALWGAVSSTL